MPQDNIKLRMSTMHAKKYIPCALKTMIMLIMEIQVSRKKSISKIKLRDRLYTIMYDIVHDDLYDLCDDMLKSTCLN